MKLRIENVDIECTVQEAVELLTQLREQRNDVPSEGKPTWIPLGDYRVPVRLDPLQPPYRITIGYPNITGETFVSDNTFVTNVHGGLRRATT